MRGIYAPLMDFLERTCGRFLKEAHYSDLVVDEIPAAPLPPGKWGPPVVVKTAEYRRRIPEFQ
jgi:hypothetical protein